MAWWSTTSASRGGPSSRRATDYYRVSGAHLASGPRECRPRDRGRTPDGQTDPPEDPAASELMAAERTLVHPALRLIRWAATLDAEPSMVRRADAFNLLGGVAKKALAMGALTRRSACWLARSLTWWKRVVQANVSHPGLWTWQRGSRPSWPRRRRRGRGRLRHRALRRAAPALPGASG